MLKRILFLTGTRADFGKLKSLIRITRAHPGFSVGIVATGMHLQHKYGYTLNEIVKSGFDDIYSFANHGTEEVTMDMILAKTVEGLSAHVQEKRPDLIVVHGDRVEALAGAIVGALNNILVAHIEGGEVSGTIDELIRHSVSKMSHVHFVANEMARKRLTQMGELPESVFVIGSPDVDVMFSNDLPPYETIQEHYQIPFKRNDFGVVMFHPVTTEYHLMKEAATNLVDAVVEDGKNYVVIFPNNDTGTHFIQEAYERFARIDSIRVFPSLRFEYFLVLLKNSGLIVGNSSAGIREAPYYGIPSVNIGSRQNNRALNPEIINCGYDKTAILEAIGMARKTGRYTPQFLFGSGRSDELFIEVLKSENFWKINRQKLFKDLNIVDRVAES